MNLLLGVGIGAVLMYFLDRRSGHRRLAVARDKSIHVRRRLAQVSGKIWHDTSHRLHGIFSEGRHFLAGDDAGDIVLMERIRARLGRVARHPGAIEVAVHEGRAFLSGAIMEDELQAVLEKVRAVRGVKDIENHLIAYKDTADVPRLQGEKPLRQERSGFSQENWTPAARFLAALGGLGALGYARRRRGVAGLAAGVAGTGFLARAMANRSIRGIVGLDAEQAAMDIRKTLNVDAPIERVFSVWCGFEEFPKFMSSVREVRETDVETGVVHWTVSGPAGVPVEWDAFVTDIIENQLIAWKTVPGSRVRHEGSVRFSINPAGGTQINVHLKYAPRLGIFGYAAAKLFGADPKRLMDEDLLRMKTFIEQNRQSHDAALVGAVKGASEQYSGQSEGPTSERS